MNKLRVIASQDDISKKWYWILCTKNGKTLCFSNGGFKSFRAMAYNLCISIGACPDFGDTVKKDGCIMRIAYVDRDRSHNRV